MVYMFLMIANCIGYLSDCVEFNLKLKINIVFLLIVEFALCIVPALIPLCSLQNYSFTYIYIYLYV